MFGGFPMGGLSPEAMKMASEQISKMSDEELRAYARQMGIS